MIGIEAIGTYLPEKRIKAVELVDQFGVEESFVEKKTGFVELARKGAAESVVDMCEAAFADLQARCPVDLEQIDYICVCTQNHDVQLPQASAMLQDRLGLSETCAGFDIALGCSGYVYSINVAEAFMSRNGLKSGLVFTCDPYSPHLAEGDKNTQLLFGDGATVTLMSDTPVFTLCNGAFATIGSKADSLKKEHDGPIAMEGREIFNFSMRNVPATLKRCLEANDCGVEDVDLFVMHQASKFLVTNLSRSLRIKPETAPFLAQDYGNTVSSSIPFGLKDYLESDRDTVVLCGFGVGLSIAAVLIRRVEK